MPQKRKHYRRIKRRKYLFNSSSIPLVIIAVTALLLGYMIKSRVTLFSRAQTKNSFYLTEEVYGKNVPDALSLNVHVKFNFDGCDGDIALYQGGDFIAGINAWNSRSGTAPFDYNEQYTRSPYIIPNDGQPHDISFSGEVRRCPKSGTVIWNEVTCTVIFDTNDLPVVSPENLCAINNLSEIQPVPKTAPRVIPPTINPEPTILEQPTDEPLPVETWVPGTIAPTPTNPTDTQVQPSPAVIPPTAPSDQYGTVPFMGIKLGKLSAAQPLYLFWTLIKSVIGWR